MVERVRVGSPTSDDINKLKERCICADGCPNFDQQMDKFMEILPMDKDAVEKGEIKASVCLIRKVEMADEFNN